MVALMLACNLQEVGEDRSVCYENLIDNLRNTQRSFKEVSRSIWVILVMYKITLKLKETWKNNSLLR